MAHATESTAPAEQVAFEPDDVTFADNRVVVTGRWSGVRGRRFVRPTLTLVGDGAPSRMLAELEHKPWNPEDGAPWTASFSYAPESGGADEVELAVAPDIAVVFPAPEPLKSRPRRAKPRGRPPRGTSASAPTSAAASEGAESPSKSTRSPKRSTAAATAATARATIQEQRAEIARLQEQVRRNELTRAEWRAATSTRDAAVAKLDAVLEERDAAAAERDTALTQRDAVVTERDAVVDRARRGRRRARTRVRSAPPTRAGTAQSDLRRERDLLAEQLEGARAAAIPAPAPGLAEPTARLPTVPLSHRFRRASAHDTERGPVALWAARLAALAVLLVVLAALALIVQSV